MGHIGTAILHITVCLALDFCIPICLPLLMLAISWESKSISALSWTFASIKVLIIRREGRMSSWKTRFAISSRWTNRAWNLLQLLGGAQTCPCARAPHAAAHKHQGAAQAARVANIYWKWTACEIAVKTLHCGKTAERPQGSCWDETSQMLLWKWVICCWRAAWLICGACPWRYPHRKIHCAGCLCCSRMGLTS